MTVGSQMKYEVFLKVEEAVINFSFPHDETRKLGPQRIMVKSSEVSSLPLLALSSIRIKACRQLLYLDTRMCLAQYSAPTLYNLSMAFE